MNRREQILAALVGVLVVGAVLNFALKRIAGQFSDRMDRIAQLESDNESKETIIQRGKVADRVLKAYKERSLPSDPYLANSRYREWLLKWVESAKISAANVSHVKRSPVAKSHDRHKFTVNCDATFAQVVDLLFRFYSADHLHRIETLKAIPAEEGKLLRLTFTVEAISMAGVERKTLSDLPAHRLAFDKVEDYQRVIVGRNFYGPANKAPTFTSSESQEGYVQRPVSVTLKAEDPDKNRVRFRLDKSDIDGLRLDESSGKIEWTPDRTGEFSIVVSAVDDGVPAKETSQTVRLAISEPPPQEERKVRRSFDEAKYTFVTGIVEINGRRQVWLTVRSEGKWLRLFEGETFQVGSFEGKIVKIYPRHVEIESQDAVLSVRYGQSISDGEELQAGPDVAASRQ